METLEILSIEEKCLRDSLSSYSLLLGCDRNSETIQKATGRENLSSILIWRVVVAAEAAAIRIKWMLL